MAWLGVWPIDTYSPNLVNFGLRFRGYVAYFCRSVTKFGRARVIGEYQSLRDFGELFREHKFFTANISDTLCRRVTKFCMIGALASEL